jgi:choline dehydrogenase-like flavoprotein
VNDVIVVGSGPGGANAAARLVEGGRRVLLLDFGNRDEHYAGLVPERPFHEIRREDPAQHRYFLGDEFELARLADHLGPRARVLDLDGRLAARAADRF